MGDASMAKKIYPGRQPSTPGPRKVSKEVANARRAEVRRALARCEMTYDICTRLSATWGISRRQVETYILQVREQAAEEMRSRGDNERAQEARQLVDGLLDIVAEARAKKDGRTATMALRELAKIQGAYAPERIEHTGAGGAPLIAAPVVDLTRFTDAEAEALTKILSAVIVPAATAERALPAATDAPREAAGDGADPRADARAGSAPGGKRG